MMTAPVPPLARFLRAWMRSGMRGGGRTARFLASHVDSLRKVPVQVADWPPVYMDLGDWLQQHWFIGSPWDASAFEQDEQTVIRRFLRPGDVVFDIGANIGLHTALMSAIVGPSGHVYAFEPNPALIPGLAMTLEQMGNGTLIQAALSDSEGEATFFIPIDDNSKSSLADWTHDATRQVSCKLLRADDLIRSGVRMPNFIKCDVEGAEMKVFGGGLTILDREDAPIVLFEANAQNAAGFGAPISAATDFLAALKKPGYRFHTVEENGELAPLGPVWKAHGNILAVPRSAAERDHAVRLSDAISVGWS